MRRLYFGPFRVSDPNVLIHCVDGTSKVLDIRPNPIVSGTPNMTLDGQKFSKKHATELWNRDKDNPWITNTIG